MALNRKNRRGVAAVEFALTLPVFMLVLAGVIELSAFISQFHIVQRAARDAARVGSITLEGPNPDGEILKQAAVDQAFTVLDAAGRPCGAGCVVAAEWFPDGDHDYISVTVSYEYVPITWAFGNLADQSVAQFTMLTQQRSERP